MKAKTLFITLLVLSLLLRIIYAVKYNAVWWDAAVYIGMGKYIFSLGAIGLWEEFRPVLWPVILGFFWKLKMNPLIIGKILEIIFGMGTIYLVYLFGSRISKNTGLLSAALLSFTQVYMFFTAVQITDIPSLFFSVLAVCLFTENKRFFSGISIGIAFSLRFTHGITLIIILTILIICKLIEKEYLELLKNSMKIIAGFIIITIPYLISNYIAYNNVLYPFTFAREVIGYSARFESPDLFFYPVQLMANNPLLIFSVIGIIIYIINFRNRNKVLDVSLASLVILTAYFTFEPHRELRYAIAFLPYYCIIAAHGFNHVISRLKIKPEYIILTIIIILFMVSAAAIPGSYTNNPNRTEFNSFFSNKTGLFIYGNSPLVVINSNVRFRAVSSWEQSMQVYSKLKNVNYIMLDTCELYCDKNDGYCLKKKQEFMEFADSLKLEFNKTSEACSLMIFRVI